MELPLISEKQWTTNIYHNLDDSEHNAEQKMPDAQRVQFSFSDILGEVTIGTESLSVFASSWGPGELTANVSRKLPGMIKNIQCLRSHMVCAFA